MVTDRLEHVFEDNGDSDIIEWSGLQPGYFEVRHTSIDPEAVEATEWGGADATLLHSTNGGATWLVTHATDLVFTGNNSFGFRLPPCLLKVAVANGTNPAITAVIKPSVV